MIDNVLIFKCKDLDNNKKFPVNYTGYGENISPLKIWIIRSKISHIGLSGIFLLYQLYPEVFRKVKKPPPSVMLYKVLHTAFTDTQDPNRPKVRITNIVLQFTHWTATLIYQAFQPIVILH